MLTPDRHLFEDNFLPNAQEILSTTLDESLPVWRLENIGRRRDYAPYLVRWENLVAHLFPREYPRCADAQTSFCSSAMRVAALREFTPSFP